MVQFADQKYDQLENSMYSIESSKGLVYRKDNTTLSQGKSKTGQRWNPKTKSITIQNNAEMAQVVRKNYNVRAATSNASSNVTKMNQQKAITISRPEYMTSMSQKHYSKTNRISKDA